MKFNKFNVGDMIEYLAPYKDSFQIIQDNRIVLKTGKILKVKRKFFRNSSFIVQNKENGFIHTIKSEDVICKVKTDDICEAGGKND